MDDILATKDLLVKVLEKDIVPTSLQRIGYMSKYLKFFANITEKINKLFTVFISGAQENTFPSYMSIKTHNIEEEKRTFYVAITRAKKRLYITCNTDGGYNRQTEKSSFISLIPQEFIEIS
jgi:ATP-dependent exoDNAse (exonuclease V) beta subunit